MATFYVDTTASVVTGNSDADSIYVQSGALQGSTILGNGGNDTINLAESLANASATGPLIEGNDGNDSIYIASANYSAGGLLIRGGTGADTIQLDGSGGIESLKTNEDNDLIRFTAGGTAVEIGMSTGADELVFSAVATTIGLGNGHDLISGSTISFTTAATVNLGDGRDTIRATLAGGFNSALILGDTSDINANNDLIDLANSVTGLSVKGAGGNDTLEISGAAQSSFFAGNAGNDSIFIDGAWASDATVGGGSGNDTIVLSAQTTTIAADINGGDGNDSIFIQGIAADVNGSNYTFELGAGADSLTISGAAVTSGSTLGQFVFSSLSDSNLAAFDTVDLGDAAGSGAVVAEFDFNNNAGRLADIGSTSASILFGDVTNKATSTNGLVVLSGSTNVSSVTAVAATVDTLTLSAGVGTFAIFKTNGGDEYLFMQGGTTGTADDSIVELAGLSATSVALANSAASITFSGAATVN